MNTYTLLITDLTTNRITETTVNVQSLVDLRDFIDRTFSKCLVEIYKPETK